MKLFSKHVYLKKCCNLKMKSICFVVNSGVNTSNVPLSLKGILQGCQLKCCRTQKKINLSYAKHVSYNFLCNHTNDMLQSTSSVFFPGELFCQFSKNEKLDKFCPTHENSTLGRENSLAYNQPKFDFQAFFLHF